MRPYRNPVQLSTWKGRLGILDIDTQLNSLKTKWIQRLLNPFNAFWKDLMLYWLNLILNPSRLLDVKTYRNKAMRIFYTVAKSLLTFHQQQTYSPHVHRTSSWTSHHFFNLVSFPTRDLKRNWVIVIDEWKRKIRKETSQKSLFKRTSKTFPTKKFT